MGGYGSGWHRGRKTKVEESLVLTTKPLVSSLEKGAGRWGSLSWSRGGEPFASISYTTEDQDGDLVIRLMYSKGSGEEKKSEAYPVKVVSTVPTYGGRRWWFICPLTVDGVPCKRRASKLYLPPGGRLFGCRHCHRLSYESAQEAHKFDGVFKTLAADMGPGWTPQAVKASLKETHTKRDLKLMEAVLRSNQVIERLERRITRRSPK